MNKTVRLFGVLLLVILSSKSFASTGVDCNGLWSDGAMDEITFQADGDSVIRNVRRENLSSEIVTEISAADAEGASNQSGYHQFGIRESGRQCSLLLPLELSSKVDSGFLAYEVCNDATHDGVLNMYCTSL